MIEYTEENIKQWNALGIKKTIGLILNELADYDTSFTLIYADVARRIAIEELEKKHPSQCMEVGIAEQTQVGVATAMALEGFNVFAIAYAPFITARILDQIRVNLGYMKAPVKLIGLGAGLSAGDLGATHTALEDIANMRGIPNMCVVSPADCTECVKIFEAATKLNNPLYIRLTIGEGVQQIYNNDYAFEIGKAVLLKEGTDLAVISNGTVTYQALRAIENLEKQGIFCTLINMHTIKPLDTEILNKIIHYKAIVTIEEHSIIGGLGTAVAEFLSSHSFHASLHRLGINDEYFSADIGAKLMEKACLTSDKIKQSLMIIYKEMTK
jgi:transketolase